jgi:hypothetical protein
VFGVDGPVGQDLAEAATTEAKRHLLDYFSGLKKSNYYDILKVRNLIQNTSTKILATFVLSRVQLVRKRAHSVTESKH